MVLEPGLLKAKLALIGDRRGEDTTITLSRLYEALEDHSAEGIAILTAEPCGSRGARLDDGGAVVSRGCSGRSSAAPT